MSDLEFFERLSGWGTTCKEDLKQVPELLVSMISIGLMHRIGFLEKNLHAVLSNNWRYLTPVHIGDTITVEYQIGNVKTTKSGEKRIVKIQLNTYNQDGELVAKGSWVLMMRVNEEAHWIVE